MLGCIFILRQDLSEARREDIEDIWDVTCAIAVFNTEDGIFSTEKNRLLVAHSKFSWADAWTRLEQISGMTDDEFNAECGQLEQETESCEDIEGEEEDDEEEESDEEDEIEDQEHDGEEGDVGDL